MNRCPLFLRPKADLPTARISASEGIGTSSKARRELLDPKRIDDRILPRCVARHSPRSRSGTINSMVGALVPPKLLRADLNNRLALASLGRVESGNRVVEGGDLSDVCAQSSVPHPLDDLTQLTAIGFHNEVDGQTVQWASLRRADDSHQRPSR